MVSMHILRWLLRGILVVAMGYPYVLLIGIPVVAKENADGCFNLP